jgi:Na+/H+-translocating membrane pyrophosphatase
MLFPLLIGASCVVTSIIGTFFVKLGANNSIMGALYKGFIATAILSAGALAAIVWGWLGGDTCSPPAVAPRSPAVTCSTAASLAWWLPA